MGSSKKHKKHKTKDREKRSYEEMSSGETAAADQRPLKLVLKVGSGSRTADRSPAVQSHTPPVQLLPPAPQPLMLPVPPVQLPPELMSGTEEQELGSSKKLKKKKSKKKHRKHHRHHHHHKHKSTCHHSKSLSGTAIDPDLFGSGPSPAMEVDEQKPMQPQNVAVTVVQDFSTVSAMDDAPKSPLKASLKSGSKVLYSNYLHLIVKTLQKRDSQDFFAWPVTDIIAPGYSSIIQRPMDFCTIHKKIDLRIYDSIQELRSDVKLLCDNCMTYNGPDTIYYKAAKKLWHFAKEKVFTRESLIEMRSSVSSVVLEPSLTVAQNPIPAFAQTDVGTETAHFPPAEPISTSAAVVVPEALSVTPEEEEERMAAEILRQAQTAAAVAAERLSLAKPHGAHYSFVRQQSDGSTSLAIVGAHPTHDRYLKLENLVGKLPEGTPYLPPYSEPESNRVKPMESVETPPFSSYLPSTDSSKSKLTPEETSLLLSAYGNEEVGVPYTRSIMEFSSDSDYLLRMADNLLDILTQGQHSKVLTHLREENKKEMSALPDAERDATHESGVKDAVTSQLQETDSLLQGLEKMQRQRLSGTSKLTVPASEELQLAATLTSKLTQIIGTCTAPVDLTDMKSVRKAMGIQTKSEQ